MHKTIGKRVLLSLFLVLVMAFLSACGGSGGKEKDSTAADTGKTAQTSQEKESDPEVEPLADVNPIPEDGIITKDQFAAVAGEERDISFVGETDDGIKYTWVYHAAQIQNPEDQNLKIRFDREDLEDIKKQANNANDALKMTMYGKGLICPPTLTVEIPEAWQSDMGMLLKEQNDKLAKMSDVTILSQPSEDKESDEDKKDSADKEAAETTTEENSGIDSLTKPKKGKTSLTMTVLSLDGDSYVVGGITDPDKLAAINHQMQSVASANANQGYDEERVETPDDEGSVSQSGDSSSSGQSGSGNSKSGDVANKDKKSSSGKKSSSSSGSSDKSSGGNSGSNSGSSSGGTCTISINCSTILNNMDNLTAGKEDFVPSDGWILKATQVSFSEGESVHDVLQRVCKEKGIHMESAFTPAYDSAYVEGINQLYEFDCGELSGWMYKVNGWFPNYGCSKYTLSDGDVINWVYTCDLGKDVGDNSMY